MRVGSDKLEVTILYAPLIQLVMPIPQNINFLLNPIRTRKEKIKKHYLSQSGPSGWGCSWFALIVGGWIRLWGGGEAKLEGLGEGYFDTTPSVNSSVY